MTDGKSDKLNSILQHLSQEQLEDLLLRDFSADGQDPLDGDLIIEILEVIRERERGTPKEIKADPDQAWQRFKTRRDTYCPECPIENPQYFDNHFMGPSPRRRRRKLRGAIAAAAVIALLSGTMVAQAFGMNVFQVFTRWTADVFSFISPDAEPPDHVGHTIFSDLESAVLNHTDTTGIVPTWAPEGYSAEDVSVSLFPGKIRLSQWFTSPSARFSVRIVKHEGAADAIDLPTYEKDAAPVEEYSVAGITHYILSNNDTYSATWVSNGLECIIQGDLSVDDLKKMIDSIYGGSS